MIKAVQNRNFSFQQINDQNKSMVEMLKQKKIITSEVIDKIMCQIDRFDFCPSQPYQDKAQSIGYQSTICSPHLHAYCLEQLLPSLKKAKKVLDVGAGSGYMTVAFALILQHFDNQTKIISKENQKQNFANKKNNEAKQQGIKTKQQDLQNTPYRINKNSQSNQKSYENDNKNDVIKNITNTENEQQQKSQEQSFLINSSARGEQNNESFFSDVVQEQTKISNFVSIGVEHIQDLAQIAYSNIQKNYQKLIDEQHIHISYTDGRNGFLTFAPYDVIYVSVSSPTIPQPLIEQLANGGTLMIPLGRPDDSQFYLISKDLNGNLAFKSLAKTKRMPLQSALEQMSGEQQISSNLQSCSKRIKGKEFQ